MLAKEKKVSGAALGESWFLVYFYIANKYPNFKIGKDQISAEYWVDYFQSGNTLESFLRKAGLTKLIAILGEDLKAIDNRNRFSVADAEKYFTKGTSGKKFVSSLTGKKVDGGGWDGALKYQATRFLRNGAVAGASKMKVLRQGEFYKLTGLDTVLGDLLKFYGFAGTLDRWNPADVWFYKQTAVTKIKKYLKDTKAFYDRPNRGKKALGIEAIMGLNQLILDLYDSKELYPVSLKKASFNRYKGRDEKNSKFGSYSFRLAAINDPRKNVKGRPNDPKLDRKEFPLREYSQYYVAGGGKDSSGTKLRYTMELDTVIYNQKGEKAYVREFNYLTFEDTPTGYRASAKPQKRYSEAQSGSLGIENMNEILWTPQIASKLRAIRNKIDGMKNGDMIDGSGSAQVGKDKIERAKSAIRYFDLLCKTVFSNLGDKPYKLSSTEANQKGLQGNSKRLKDIQNDLEILLSIEKSKDPVEMVFDLWKAAVAKGQTSRKAEFNAIVKNLQDSKKMKMEDAEEEAEKLLMARVPSAVKVPSSFHLKLY
jgi:hypothetical protein